MGAGNWYPSVNRGDRNNYELLYIDTEEIYVSEEALLSSEYQQISYDDFESNVLGCLPRSFTRVQKHTNNRQFILADNSMFECLVQDNQWAVAVAFIVKENAPAFAESKLHELGSLVFDRLHDIYGDYARVRNGPWMSGPYKEKEALCTASM